MNIVTTRSLTTTVNNVNARGTVSKEVHGKNVRAFPRLLGHGLQSRKVRRERYSRLYFLHPWKTARLRIEGQRGNNSAATSQHKDDQSCRGQGDGRDQGGGDAMGLDEIMNRFAYGLAYASVDRSYENTLESLITTLETKGSI